MYVNITGTDREMQIEQEVSSGCYDSFLSLLKYGYEK